MGLSHEFPASAAKPLVEGYCEDFVSLASALAQTLEQMDLRGIDVAPCRQILLRAEGGMRGLADAIRALLERAARGERRQPPAAATPAPAAPAAPATPAAPPAPKAPESLGSGELKGTSQTIPVLSVFQFLSRMRKSGTLHVDIGDERLTFDFVDGAIEASTSDRNLPEERLGELLLAKFPALRPALQPILQRKDGRLVRRLGAELVQKGLCSNGQVVEALELQVAMRYRRVIAAALARYSFEQGERVPGDGRIRIRPFELEFARKEPPK